jgi:DME family drug/metabolite transporter
MVFTLPWLQGGSLSMPRTEYARGVLYATGAGIALGTLGPVSNLAYGAGMSSPTFAALRAGVGAIALGAVLVAGRGEWISLRSLSTRERSLLALTATVQALLSLCVFAAYGSMAVALVLAVYFCYPLLVATASVALGRERLTRTRIAALAISVVGLGTVVLGGATSGLGAFTLVGFALAAMAALCQATYLVASRSGFTRVASPQATAIILTGAAVLMSVVAIPAELLSAHPGAWLGSPLAWVSILVAGILGAAVAKVWMLRGVRRVGGTRAAVLMLVEPLTGVLLAAVVLGQALSPVQVAGGVMILGGALLAQRPASARSEHATVRRRAAAIGGRP